VEKNPQSPEPGNTVHNIVSVIKTSSKACCRFHHLVLVQFDLFKTYFSSRWSSYL